MWIQIEIDSVCGQGLGGGTWALRLVKVGNHIAGVGGPCPGAGEWFHEGCTGGSLGQGPTLGHTRQIWSS